MLMLGVSEGEFVQIGKDIRVYFITRNNCKQIRLGIEAPDDINIVRSTVLMRNSIKERLRSQELAINGGTTNE